MTDKEILAMRESGLTRAEIAVKTGKTERQIKSALLRARRDPAVSAAMAAIGTGMVPSSLWVKTDGYSVQLKPKAEANDADNLITRLQEAFSDIPAYEPVPVTLEQSDKLSVYALFDAHFGMRAYGKETGGEDYDLKLAETDVKSAFARMVQAGPVGGEAVLILGGDTLHHDDNTNATPASRHALDVDGRIFKVTMEVVDVIAWVAEHLAQTHEKVTIKVHRGNHDPSSHVALAVGLHQRYRATSRIVVDMGQQDWFWKQWGKCAIFTTHGDRGGRDNFIHKMADVCPFWSESPYRVAITGHVHKMQSQRIGGAMWYSVDAFCPPDEYGSQFPGRRGLSMMVFDKKRGHVATHYDGVWRE